MSNIPEHIMMQVRRLNAEGMPAEQIAFFTRIDQDIIEAERLFAKSGCGQALAVRVGEAVQHQADRGQLDHRLGDLG